MPARRPSRKEVASLRLTPDDTIAFYLGQWGVNLTIAFTWLVMGLLLFFAWLGTRPLRRSGEPSRWQLGLEIIVEAVADQIRPIAADRPERFVPFVGTLFLYIATCNVLSIVPGFEPPTGSLSTTAGLAICVLFAVPYFGVRERGLGPYLRSYIEPNPIMLPFNIIGELSRTLSLAIRLFGNVMSGSLIAAVLLAVIPLLFPAVMQAFGLLTGLIQAYIFAVLATVYIASAVEVQHKPNVSHQSNPLAGEDGSHADN